MECDKTGQSSGQVTVLLAWALEARVADVAGRGWVGTGDRGSRGGVWLHFPLTRYREGPWARQSPAWDEAGTDGVRGPREPMGAAGSVCLGGAQARERNCCAGVRHGTAQGLCLEDPG